jgi:hypothetical protein
VSRPADKATEALSPPLRDPHADDAADVVMRLAAILRLVAATDAGDTRWKIQINFLATALGPLVRTGKSAKLELRNGMFHLNQAARSGWRTRITARCASCSERCTRSASAASSFRGSPTSPP